VNVADQTEPANLRFLRILVTVLTATMIVGLAIIVGVFVTKFSDLGDSRAVLPDEIAVPVGETARAFTRGGDWLAVVTVDDKGRERIRILDMDGSPRQVIEIAP